LVREAWSPAQSGRSGGRVGVGTVFVPVKLAWRPKMVLPSAEVALL
jgi:hypothetical protein